MLVRVTSDNLIENGNLELFDKDGKAPVGWDNFSGGSATKSEWVLDDSQTLYYPEGIEFVCKEDDFFNNVSIIKYGTVKGSGVYKNIPSVVNNLTNYYRRYTDTDTEQQEIQNRYITVSAGEKIFLKEIATVMQFETNMLFTKNFSEGNNRTLRVVRNATGRTIESTGIYTPLTTSFSFVNCESKIKAISTFFKTCLKYRVGYNVEAFITPDTAEYWGNFLWGNSQWGGFNVDGEWVKMFHVDTSNFSFVESSTGGMIDISAILQKSEVNNVG